MQNNGPKPLKTANMAGILPALGVQDVHVLGFSTESGDPRGCRGLGFPFKVKEELCREMMVSCIYDSLQCQL